MWAIPYQTVFPRVILEAIRTLDKRSGNETTRMHGYMHMATATPTKGSCCHSNRTVDTPGQSVVMLLHCWKLELFEA